MATNVAESNRALRICQVPYGHADVATLTAQVQDHYIRLYGGPDTTPVDAAGFSPPRGAFFVGYLAELAVAMGGWRWHGDPLDIPATRPAEIKRMFVVEAARGRGLARRILAHLETTAAAAGADALVLETGEAQPDAIALYRAAGYVDIPRFGHYAAEPSCVHLGRWWQPLGAHEGLDG